MAKFRLWSDLHLESGSWSDSWFENSEGQHLLLAGDIVELRKIPSKMDFFRKCSESFISVSYIPGNHEFWSAYTEKWDTWVPEQFAAAGLTNINVLQQSEVQVEDVTIFGATMWYDASSIAHGTPRQFLIQESNDFKYITTQRRGPFSKLRGEDVLFWHVRHTSWLKQRLAECTTKKIVMTHHAPTEFSKDPRWPNHDHFGYVNQLDLTEYPADLWVHGHIHCSLWYEVDGVQVTCNPRGYEIYNAVNPKFDPHYTLEV